MAGPISKEEVYSEGFSMASRVDSTGMMDRFFGQSLNGEFSYFRFIIASLIALWSICMVCSIHVR
jgi:hypothetical protein